MIINGKDDYIKRIVSLALKEKEKKIYMDNEYLKSIERYKAG
jgi:hypothetical protein